MYGDNPDDYADEFNERIAHDREVFFDNGGQYEHQGVETMKEEQETFEEVPKITAEDLKEMIDAEAELVNAKEKVRGLQEKYGFRQKSTTLEHTNQNSVALKKDAKGNYNWEVKIYFDFDEDITLERIQAIDKVLRNTYAGGTQ